MILGTIICLMVGVAGLLTATMVSFHGGVEEPLRPLRGSSAACPVQVPPLDAEGMLQDDESVPSSLSYRPPCASSSDPQEGTYAEYTAPASGRVTLTAWSIWVDAGTCACTTDVTSTRSVIAGQTLRLWTPRNGDNKGPLVHFVVSDCPAPVDETVSLLDDGGRVMVTTPDDNVDPTTTMTKYHNAPTCVSSSSSSSSSTTTTSIPQVGRYYDWIAPADGVMTLSPRTVLLQDVTTCACADHPTVTQQTVTAGQRVRVWTPSALDGDQLLQFLGKLGP